MKTCVDCGTEIAPLSARCISCYSKFRLHVDNYPPSTNNDGSNDNTNHYNLPEGATEIKHLIWYKDMNAQVGEIFRACYRLGTATHSSRERDLNKIIAYAEQELERMKKYEKSN